MYKVALVSICLNPQYWPYLGPMVESARKYLLKGHQVDFFVWSDIGGDIPHQIKNGWKAMNVNPYALERLPEMVNSTLRVKDSINIIPQEPAEWPLPTLHRYHLFLREAERLKDYDYIFYCDADMLFVAPVGDEILGDLVAAQHPMHAHKRGLVPPYEPNLESSAYIPRPGKVIKKEGKDMFQPLYFAGGFQGGRSDKFIEAMKVMKRNIDKDFSNNYVAIWNDETHWNKYCFDNPPTVVLSPSYIYPDSLIRSYYMPVWGKNYVPKIITLTKPFTTSKAATIELQTKI